MHKNVSVQLRVCNNAH